MPVSDTQLAEMFERVLTLSKVEAGQTVAVLTSSYSNPRLIGAAMTAAVRMKTKAFRVDLPAVNHDVAMGNDLTAYMGASPLAGNTAATRALAEADLVLDLMLLLFSPEQGEILKNGARMLLVVEPPEILARMLPTEDDKRRVLAATERLKRAKTFHVTSKAGTDLRCKLGEYPVLTEYGFAEEPGRWDHWPSGFLATWPNEGTAEGKIVLEVGDILFPFKSYVQSRVTLEVRDGYVKSIHGGFDADFLNTYMQGFKDPEVFAISHMGWGLQPRAKWEALGLYDKNETLGMDGRAFYGNFLFSTGPNSEAGGARNTPCHMDIPMRNCSVSLDGEPMTIDGKVIPKDQAVAA